MSRFNARIVMMIALAAIMLRVLIPVGYMPDVASGKLFTMTICTIHGPQQVTLDDKFNPVSKSSLPHGEQKECPFSVLQNAALHDDFVGQAFTAAFDLKPAKQPLADYIILAKDVCECASQPRAPPAAI